jgi:hypothetical protein
MKNNNCFYCVNAKQGEPAENTGWYHPCSLDHFNEDMQKIEQCPDYYPCNGFQMGGHYTHTHFECSGPGECMMLYIHGDLEFPQSDPRNWLKIHICEFQQIEQWVKFWGGFLRSRGLVIDED